MQPCVSCCYYFTRILQICGRMNEEVEPPTKKRRVQPNKKWRDREVLLIIDFLCKEEDFEVPTAQIFYKRFLEKTRLDASWDLVRWKVRHLKAQFRKASDWLESAGAGLLEEVDDRTIQAKVGKMCPFFDRLKEVFGKNTVAIQPALVTADVLTSASSRLSSASPSRVYEFVNVDLASNTESSNAAPSSVPRLTNSSASPRTRESRSQKFFISQLATIQKERIMVEKTRLEFEQKRFEKEKEIEERKMIIEDKKLQIEIKKIEFEDKWKKAEMDLKEFEIQMKERVAKYEIDQKYKK